MSISSSDEVSNFKATMTAKIGGELISQTLGLMDSNKSGGNAVTLPAFINDSTEMQKSVLSAAYLGKGTAIDADS